MRRKSFPLCLVMLFMMVSCVSNSKKEFSGQKGEIKLIVIDPGHFHAALLQKQMYEQVDPTVHVYAPDGAELNQYLKYIEQYNTRSERPTEWLEVVYKGDDFLSKMIAEKKGNVLITSGNNQKKTEYIRAAISAGINVLADKPMAINVDDFTQLTEAFQQAAEKNLLLYDIMTERFEITNMLQKELSLLPEVFGTLKKGTPDDPAVIKESVHHFMKFASGNPVIRPAWYFDVEQQGEGLVDVTTHLIDLIQWTCFPEVCFDYTKDVDMLASSRWPTVLSREQFAQVTGVSDYPAYLKKDVKEDQLHVYANGEMNYRLRDVHVKLRVVWNYVAPEGTGDTHYSILRGSKANLIVRQGQEQGYKPKLYIQPVVDPVAFGNDLTTAFGKLASRFEGISLKKLDGEWEVVIPEKYYVGHEAHFGQVAENYFRYLTDGKLPEWEVPYMLTKYYTTIQASLKAENKILLND